MEQKPYTYIIGDRTFVQRPVSLGQARQISKTIKCIILPNEINPSSLLVAFGDQIPNVLAIVLLESASVDGKSADEVRDYLRSRDMDALASDIEWTIDPVQTLQVIEDFFGCNPTASLFEKFAGLIEKFKGAITQVVTSSNQSLSLSPVETSPIEMTSSGDSPSPSADRI